MSNLCWSWLGKISILLVFLFQMALSELGKVDQSSRNCKFKEPESSPGLDSISLGFVFLAKSRKADNLFFLTKL